MYPQYKAHRQPHPPALTEAVSRILAVVDALGIPILAVPGVEADDVVGTLAVKAERDGFGSVVIMSIDKVSLIWQLVCTGKGVLLGSMVL
jgi:DNA polymerase-1